MLPYYVGLVNHFCNKSRTIEKIYHLCYNRNILEKGATEKMIIIRLDEIRKEHRFSIMMIHEETGISRSTLTEMSYGRIKRIDLDTLDRLCTFFNKYIPGFKLTDLINYISD